MTWLYGVLEQSSIFPAAPRAWELWLGRPASYFYFLPRNRARFPYSSRTVKSRLSAVCFRCLGGRSEDEDPFFRRFERKAETPGLGCVFCVSKACRRRRGSASHAADLRAAPPLRLQEKVWGPTCWYYLKWSCRPSLTLNVTAVCLKLWKKKTDSV